MNKAKTAIEIFNEHARAYQDKFMGVDLYADTLSTFCNSIPKQDAHILDIACGPGNLTKHLLTLRPYYKILGIDLAPQMLELAKQNNPGAEFQLMDCRDISTLNQKYSGIICGFGLPYLTKHEAIQLITDAAKILTPAGALYLSTMEDDYYLKSGYKTSSTGDQLYIHYHQADYLTQVMEENGFGIIVQKRIDYEGYDGEKMVDLVLVGKR